MRIPESQIPFGIPGTPDVLLWKLAPHVHRTVSPGLIVTDEGENTRLPPGATVTSTVTALAFGQLRSRAIVAVDKVTRQKKVFCRIFNWVIIVEFTSVNCAQSSDRRK